MPWVPSQQGNYLDFRATAGVIPGLDVFFDSNQFSSSTALRVFGAVELASVATGVNKGMAGVGTTTTSLVKPTGAVDWTAAELEDRGVYVRLVAGGGAPTDGSEVFAEVLSNTTTAITVNAVPGMDATTRFQLVTMATVVDQISAAVKIGIRALACGVPLEIYGLSFTNVNGLDSLIAATDGASVKMSGININANTANPAVYIQRCNNVEISSCYLTSAGDIEIEQCNSALVTSCDANGGGQVLLEDCLVGKILKHTAVDSPSRVASWVRCNYGQGEVTANDSLATPIYIESCNTFDAAGTLLVGTNADAPYGIEVARAGNLSLVGCTIAGTADVLFQGDPVTWAQLSSPSYGVVQKYAGSAVATVGQTKALVRGNYAFEGDLNLGGRFLTFGYCNIAANATAITLTGTDSIDMSDGRVNGAPATTEAPRGCLDVICNSATAQAILPDNEAIAGGYGWILNHGSQALPIVPPSGGAIIGATSAPVNKITFFASINALSGRTFFVAVLP